MTERGLVERSPALVTFGVMVVAIVGGGVLALPVALASFGPRRAVAILVIMGLINLASLLALSSAISRSTATASGRGRLATLTGEHLGPTAALATTAASIALWFGLLVVYVLGLATSLGEIAGSPVIWAVTSVGIIGILVFVQARKVFVASATTVAVINVVILAVMITAVALRARADLFTAGPLPTDGGSDTASTLELVFGTVLFAYFGHTALFSIAPDVTRADPSGRALRRGATAAMVTAIVINVGWVVACLSAIPAEQYLAEDSTGIGLVVDAVGGWMQPLSVVFVILAMGVAGLNAAFALGDVIAERLPGLRRVSTVLRPGSSVEAFDQFTSARVTVTPVVEEGRTVLIARGRCGRRHERQVIDGSDWDGSMMLQALGISRRRAVLRVRTEGTASDGVIVTVESALPLTEHEPPAMRAALLGSGSAGEHAELEQLGAMIIQTVVRQPAEVDQVLAAVAVRADVPRQRVLEAFSIVEHERRVGVRNDGLLHPTLGQRSGSRSAVVEALFSGLSAESDPAGTAPGDAAAAIRAAALADGMWRRAAQASPAVLAALIVLGLIAADAGFAAAIDLVAMATILLLGGVVPVVLGRSLRRRAERSTAASRFADHPISTVVLLALYTVIPVIYATVIYDQWYQRLAAGFALVVTGVLIVSGLRSGGFAPRSTLLVQLTGQGDLTCEAHDGGVARHVTGPTQVAVGAASLTIDVRDGLEPPMLIIALDGEAVPARLGRWSLSINGDEMASGHLEDAGGQVVDWPTDVIGPLRCTWQLR